MLPHHASKAAIFLSRRRWRSAPLKAAFKIPDELNGLRARRPAGEADQLMRISGRIRIIVGMV